LKTRELKDRRRHALHAAAVFAVVAWCVGAAGQVRAQSNAADAGQIAQGEYLVRAAGCIACHTDEKNGGARFAGGRALKTPFGTYFSPNITPDEATGIGAWSDDDFVAALRYGERPDGSHYFPVFPYTSYTRMTVEDMRAIKAYLLAQPPVNQRNRAHDVVPPFSWRWTMMGWKLLYFTPGSRAHDPAHDAAWNRGAYLVEALAHCGECHTPRNLAGAMDEDMYLAGTVDGPDGELVPNITPDKKTGIGDWSHGDIVALLRDGLKPNYDDVQGSMAEAIRDGLKHLTDEDLSAIATYLRTIPPIENKLTRKSQ
jgi:mono/diheme cytochrome c family protein